MILIVIKWIDPLILFKMSKFTFIKLFYLKNPDQEIHISFQSDGPFSITKIIYYESFLLKNFRLHFTNIFILRLFGINCIFFVSKYSLLQLI